MLYLLHFIYFNYSCVIVLAYKPSSQKIILIEETCKSNFFQFENQFLSLLVVTLSAIDTSE